MAQSESESSPSIMKTRRLQASRVLPCRHRLCRPAQGVALGQRVFKSEPKVDHVAPNATVLGQANVYDDGQ